MGQEKTAIYKDKESWAVFRIRIRMDPVFFFADPDQCFKSTDPDPSMYKLM